MLTVIAVAGVALIAGALLGWLLGGPRVQRAEVARAAVITAKIALRFMRFSFLYLFLFLLV